MSVFETFYFISIILFHHSNWTIWLCINISLICINTSIFRKENKSPGEKKNQNKESKCGPYISCSQESCKELFFFLTQRHRNLAFASIKTIFSHYFPIPTPV